MSDQIVLPKSDSLTLTFLLQDSAGAASAFDAATLTVKGGGTAGADYTLSGVIGPTGVATFTVPPAALASPASYTAAVTATGTGTRNTLSFTLRVTDHP